MLWNSPKDRHIVYEALSAIADGRFQLIDEQNAKCVSTSQGKFYSIKFDQPTMSIMSDDNMAFYVGEVSYPMVAMLLAKKVISYDEKILKELAGIKWNDLNQKNKNDYMKTVFEVLATLKEKDIDSDYIDKVCTAIFNALLGLKLQLLGNKIKPPSAY